MDVVVVEVAVVAEDVDAVPSAVVEAWTGEAQMPGAVANGDSS